MRIYGINSDKVVWSDSGATICVDEYGPASDALFTVLLEGNVVASFKLSPVNDSFRLPLRDLLRAILPKLDPPSSGQEVSPISVHRQVTIQMGIDGDLDAYGSVVFYACLGGEDDKVVESVTVTHWLTWKPQVTVTYPWAKEYLALLKAEGSVHNQVVAKLYWKDHGLETVQLAVLPIQNYQQVLMMDCSCERVLALSSVEDDTLMAYDVEREGFMPHRFLIGDEDRQAREFIFRNSLGVFDTVFATGDVSRETGSEVVTVRSASDEREVNNDAVERFAAQSGTLTQTREIDQWQDFFRSSERYVLLPGDVVRRIVVDGLEQNLTEHIISGVKVTYHYADAFTGRHYDDTELDDYDYTSEQ